MVDTEQAKARLDELLDMVETGEEAVINRRGAPVAYLSSAILSTSRNRSANRLSFASPCRR